MIFLFEGRVGERDVYGEVKVFGFALVENVLGCGGKPMFRTFCEKMGE